MLLKYTRDFTLETLGLPELPVALGDLTGSIPTRMPDILGGNLDQYKSDKGKGNNVQEFLKRQAELEILRDEGQEQKKLASFVSNRQGISRLSLSLSGFAVSRRANHELHD